MKQQTYFDHFDDWGPEEPAKFEPMANRLRRLEPLTVTWRGAVHHFEPEARLMLGERTTVTSMISLWGPTSAGSPFPRRGWMADLYVEGFGFIGGKGETPQAALDALDLILERLASSAGGGRAVDLSGGAQAKARQWARTSGEQQ